MTDKEFNKQRARIDALWKKWGANLTLGPWQIVLRYCREPIPGKDGTNKVGEAHVMWEYRQATLMFYLPGLADMTDAQVERLFVHECCHVLVHETREWCQTEHLPEDVSAGCMKHEERVVSQMAQAFLWVWEAGEKAGRKKVS